MGQYSHEELAQGAAVAAGVRRQRRRSFEWPTYLAIAGCYAAWSAAVAAYGVGWLSLLLFAPLAAYCVALQSSLRHEALHGHPTRSIALNEALVFPPFCLVIPYRRFRDMHLRHHFDARLTDPYDDPESWFLAHKDFAALSRPMQAILRVNNTLAGRLVIGPWLTVLGMACHDGRAIICGNRRVARAWALHLAGALPVIGWLMLWHVPVWLYLLTVTWPAISLLMLRTFAEHQAHPEVAQRTALIEASPVVSFLFLNNNLHFLHHKRPRVPWYELPKLYRAEREALRAENGGYGFASYLDLARRHLWRARQPVAHPFLRK